MSRYSIYKHKETGEYYNLNGGSDYNNKKTAAFSPFNKSLDKIRIESNDVIDEDKFKCGTDEYKEACRINNDKLKSLIHNTFDEIEATPKFEVSDKPKYIELFVDIKCPICGHSLKQVGGVKLSYPAQYDHVCTNEKCGYNVCLSGFYSGQHLWYTSAEEAYRIINEGTFAEKENLLSVTIEENRNHGIRR